MSTIEFIYNNLKINIQCKPEDKINDSIQKFIIKTGKNINNLYFLYGGEKIKENLTFNELANNEDKARNQMNIIVVEIEADNLSKNLKKSKNLICPECKKNIIMSINHNKITLYGCINSHTFENLSLKEFEKTQNIDESKIYCGKCQNNKNITYNNLFNFCFSCQLNLCPLCTSTHDKTHNIIDYELKNFICKKHFESFFSYCKECRQDICLLCEREHEDHEIISYGGIIPNIDNIKKQMKIFKEKKDEYKNYLDKIIEKLNNIKKDYDGYYIIYNNIINNYASKNRNYAILKNINDNSIYINDFINIINKNKMKTIL